MCDGVLDFFNLGMLTNKMSILTIFDHKCFKHKFDQFFLNKWSSVIQKWLDQKMLLIKFSKDYIIFN